ncbi:hypothetical protein ABPG72_015483 [Tetrahymena utriculariae]
MAYNQESTYLDLKKQVHNFSYESLFQEGQILEGKDIQQDQLNELHEGVSQNTYLFVQEKDILQADVKNVCLYFRHTEIEKQSNLKEEQIKKFPFTMITERLNYIIQKYQEQPILLDTVMDHIILPLMEEINLYLQKFMKESLQYGEDSEFIQNKNQQSFHQLISVVYMLCKVRHYKHINKFFPHEVKDLEPVVYYLIVQRARQTEIWETKYVLLLWMSIIILVPFDLVTIDSQHMNMEIFDAAIINSPALRKQQGVSTPQRCKGITNNLIEIGKYYLNSSTKLREASSQFLSNFFARTDIQKTSTLYEFIEWAIKTVQQFEKDPFSINLCAGIYSSIVEIFKIGQRREFLKIIPLLTPLIKYEDEKGKKIVENTALRHLKCKLAQRIGMVYLRPRPVAWAYRRGNNSLLENMKKTITDTKLQTNVQKVENKQNQSVADAGKNSKTTVKSAQEQAIDLQNSQQYFEDVDQEKLECIIDFLLECLRDKTTVVRWSAAKGIGRITSRLDISMADDIVNAILDLFSPNETEDTWHGGCLTLGELSRRGLLLPSRLKEVFPILYKALHFDQNQGNYSVGANVRDSACYITWAFARAYDPEVLQPYVEELAKNLLITCLYDREVNCRRAASAAFQEHVGRQGSFPHGIQILTEADYFTLGLRNNAYLNIGLYVSHYKVYLRSFIEHLAFSKLRHQDIDLRRLSASSLCLMTSLDPEFMIKDVLRSLLNYVTHDTVEIRHGALYGIAEILVGAYGRSDLHNMKGEMKDSVFLKTLSSNERKLIKAGEYMSKFKEDYEVTRFQNSINILLGEDTLAAVLDVVNQIEKARLFRGKGGEFMRVAVCRLIEAISISNLPAKAVHLKRYMDTLEECLKSFIDNIQLAASKALKIFSATYHNEPKKEFNQYVTKFISSASTDLNVAVTRGYTLGLSSFSPSLLKANLPEILRVLGENCKTKSKDEDDADTRKYAVNAFYKIIAILGLDSNTCLSQEQFNFIFDQCKLVMADYTMDKRGDIGSIVREASMVVQQNILKKWVSSKQQEKEENRTKLQISSELMHSIICLILQQLSEKIDRVRLVAGSVLQEIFDNFYNILADFPKKKELYAIFNKQNIKSLVQKDEDRMDAFFETDVIKAELTHFSNEQNVKINDFIFYWNQPHGVYPIITPILQLVEYNYYIIKGLSVSVGGITESVVKHSLGALTQFISNISKTQHQNEVFALTFENIIKILNEYAKEERVVIPMFKTLDFMFEKSEIQEWAKTNTYGEKIFEIICKEIKGTKSILKIPSCVGLIVGLMNLQKESIQNDMLELILSILTHKFPKVRKAMSDKLYLLLLASGEDLFGEEKSDACIELLMERDWLEEKQTFDEVEQKFRDIFSLTKKTD